MHVGFCCDNSSAEWKAKNNQKNTQNIFKHQNQVSRPSCCSFEWKEAYPEYNYLDINAKRVAFVIRCWSVIWGSKFGLQLNPKRRDHRLVLVVLAVCSSSMFSQLASRVRTLDVTLSWRHISFLRTVAEWHFPSITLHAHLTNGKSVLRKGHLYSILVGTTITFARIWLELKKPSVPNKAHMLRGPMTTMYHFNIKYINLEVRGNLGVLRMVIDKDTLPSMGIKWWMLMVCTVLSC